MAQQLFPGIKYTSTGDVKLRLSVGQYESGRYHATLQSENIGVYNRVFHGPASYTTTGKRMLEDLLDQEATFTSGLDHNAEHMARIFSVVRTAYRDCTLELMDWLY